MLTPYDLFRNDDTGSPIWVGTAEDMNSAKARLAQLVTVKPGIYQIYDSRNAKFIEALERST